MLNCAHEELTILECYDDVKVLDVDFILFNMKPDTEDCKLLEVAHIAKIYCHQCEHTMLGHMFILDEVVAKNF